MGEFYSFHYIRLKMQDILEIKTAALISTAV